LHHVAPPPSSLATMVSHTWRGRRGWRCNGRNVAATFALLCFSTRTSDSNFSLLPDRAVGLRAGPPPRSGSIARRQQLWRRCKSDCAELFSEWPPELNWLQVADDASIEAAGNATVLPIFPLSGIEWPGSEVQLNIIDPAYRRMYDDLLASGARRFVVPFTRSLPGGRVRYAEMLAEDRRLHEIGTVLQLDDLKEVSGQTGDAVKYVAKHSVRGRARLMRLLNPSALFKTDERGNKIDYLRAEVVLLDDADDSDEEAFNSSSLASQLDASWKELYSLAEEVDEPRFGGREAISDWVARLSTWDLAQLWQQLQLAVRASREQKRVLGDVKSWLESREEGDLSDPSLLDASSLPEDLREALYRSQQGVPSLGPDFWEPLLAIVASEDALGRGRLLVRMAEEEVRLMRTRSALKDALG